MGNKTTRAADEETTKAATDTMTEPTGEVVGQEAPPEKPAWPIEGKTVALAAKAKPVVVDSKVNIGMEGSLFLPDEETQRAGFTPYLRKKGGKPVDATALLLSHFGGIYKPYKEKGE